MASIEQLIVALRNAHNAGDIEGASRIAVLLKEKSAAEAEPVEQKPDSQGLGDYARGLAQSVNKGTLLGFGDELVGAARAGIDRFLPNNTYDFGGDVSMEKQSADDQYAMYRDDERDVTKQFEDENKKTALTANLVGGFASPINRIAPGGFKSGKDMTDAAFKARAALRAQQAATASLRGGIEGGIQGFGEGEGSIADRLDSASTGAAWGMGLGGGLNLGGGIAGRIASKRRIQDAVDVVTRNGKKIFRPPNLAGPETGMGKFVRDTLGVAYGGGNVGKLESKYLRESLARTGADTEKLIPITAGTTNPVKDVKKAILNDKKSAITAAENAKETAIGSVQRQTDDVLDDIASRTEAQKNALLAQNADDINVTYDAGAKSSLPDEHLSVLDDVDTLNPRESKKAIESFWKKDGFRMIKDRDFDWDWEGNVDVGLQRSIKEALAEDPNLAIQAAGELQKIEGLVSKLKQAGMTGTDLAPQDFIEQMLETSKKNGISGEALMEIRNVFARAANKSGASAAPGMVRSKIDGFISGQLDDEAASAFKNQKEAYRNWIPFSDAVDATDAAKGGRFNVLDYRNQATRIGRQDRAPLDELTLPMQERANALPEAKKRLESEAIASSREARSVLRETVAEQTRKANLAKRRQGQRADARKNYVERESRGIGAENPSSGNKIVATAQLGLLPASVIDKIGPMAAAAVPLGMGVAKGLSTETGLRTLAGQTDWQKKLAENLLSGSTGQVTQALSRLGAGQATGE